MKKGASLLLGMGIAAVVYAVTRKGSAPTPQVPPASSKKLCDSPPPSPQPKVPAGFSIFRGEVDDIAQGVANNMLGNAIGDSEVFQDGSGRTLLALSLWHCKNEGTPLGWHKGVTLFQKVT